MNEHMSDKDIFEMLSPKLEKNGITTNAPSVVYSIGEDIYKTDHKEELIKAVALAYRCGYGRGSKGRPFDYADKEIKEVPVNKELRVGARVKMVKDYSSGYGYKEWYPSVGIYGTVKEINESFLRVDWDSETIKNNCYNNNSWWCEIVKVEVIE